MRTYLAEIKLANGTIKHVTLLAVSVWQAIALIHARHGARTLFIETI